MKGLHRLFVCTLAALSPGTAFSAQDAVEASSEAKLAFAKELIALEVEFKEARSAVFTEMRKLPREEQSSYFRENRPDPEEYVPRFFDLAERAAGTEVALGAYRWVIVNSQEDENFLVSMDVLMRGHIDSDGMVEICGALMRRRNGVDTLEEILAESRNPKVQGNACYNIAKRYADGLDRGQGPPTAREDAERYLEKVIAEYASFPCFGGPTLGDAAKRTLFAIRNLVIGKTAPDIEGEDIDGNAFKLSDYRGKVVVLDFWGNW